MFLKNKYYTMGVGFADGKKRYFIKCHIHTTAIAYRNKSAVRRSVAAILETLKNTSYWFPLLYLLLRLIAGEC